MKVLQAGIDPCLTWKKEYTCTGKGNGGIGCGSKLEVEYNDLRYYKGSESPWNSSGAAVCFRCPVCGNLNDLDIGDWPSSAMSPISSMKKYSDDWRKGVE